MIDHLEFLLYHRFKRISSKWGNVLGLWQSHDFSDPSNSIQTLIRPHKTHISNSVIPRFIMLFSFYWSLEIEIKECKMNQVSVQKTVQTKVIWYNRKSVEGTTLKAVFCRCFLMALQPSSSSRTTWTEYRRLTQVLVDRLCGVNRSTSKDGGIPQASVYSSLIHRHPG